MKIRESKLTISSLVETQGQLLVEQIARLDKLEEKINATSTYNITNAVTTNNSSNLSTSIQNNTNSTSTTPAAGNSTAVDNQHQHNGLDCFVRCRGSLNPLLH